MAQLETVAATLREQAAITSVTSVTSSPNVVVTPTDLPKAEGGGYEGTSAVTESRYAPVGGESVTAELAMLRQMVEEQVTDACNHLAV